MLREKILFKVYVPETIIQIRIICRFLWLYNLSYGTLQNKDTIWGSSGWMFIDSICGKLMSRVMRCAGLFFLESAWHMGRHDDMKVLWRWAEHLEPDEVNRNKQNHLMRF